jgi:ATP-dependent helicase Lhr and Lhr-like helicase
VILPPAEAAGWEAWLAELAAAGRAAPMTLGEGAWWVATERRAHAEALVADLRAPSGVDLPASTQLPTQPSTPAPQDPVLALVRGWVPHLGPVTADGLAARVGLAPAATAGALAGLEAEGRVLRGTFLPGAPWSPDAPHWCERGVLARIHRLTLGRLRRDIEPVSAATFLRFLARWQHAAPGTRLHGERGLLEVLGQLQGFHAAAGAWERDLLPARVAGYEPRLLDALCSSGEVAWGRLEVAAQEGTPRRRSAPTRAAPVTLVLREDLAWLLDASAPEAPPLGALATTLVETLARRGASFLGELAPAVGASPGETEEALWELVSAGRVTCDGFAGLRTLIAPSRWRAARPAGAGGRWALLRPSEGTQLTPGSAAPPGGAPVSASARHRTSSAAPAAPPSDATLERLAHQYLRRYGVVLRDLLAREARPPPWRELVRVYRALEARGVIRGGRFVAGFTGEQFAAPEAVEALRAARRAGADQGERVELSAADPLNLAGILTPGPRFSAAQGGRVVLEGGVPAAAPEHHPARPAASDSASR